MSLTTDCTCSAEPTVIFSPEAWDATMPQIRQSIVDTALPCAFYGTFASLCGVSIYSLLRHNNRNRATTLTLSLALLALFPSTTIYTVPKILTALQDLYNNFLFTGIFLWLNSRGVYVDGDPPLTTDYTRPFRYWAPTCTLTINILFGDAIVCWRACVLWQGNKIFVTTCVMLLVTTFALGIVDTVYTSIPLTSGNLESWKPDPHANGDGTVYQGFSYGLAATALSLITNLFATVAVAVKAWQSRRVLRRYVVTGPMSSQMEKVLSILVESGTIYCALWVVVLVWQGGVYLNVNREKSQFWYIFSIFMSDALVPLIAIYPTFIIVLVALNRSHFESGFTTPTQSGVYRLPLRPITVSVDTTATAHYDGQPRGDDESVGVLIIGEEDVKSQTNLDYSSTHFTEEQKSSGGV